MTLLDVFLVINGRTIGPFVAVAPVDARGETYLPKPGDETFLLIRKNGDVAADRSHVWGRMKLEK